MLYSLFQNYIHIVQGDLHLPSILTLIFSLTIK